MSFVVYDITFLALFILIVGFFLYRHRSRAKWEGILLLYRTQIGIKFIDYVDTHYGRYISKLKWVIISAGYISMIIMTYMLVQLLYVFFKSPDIVRAVKIPPLAPLIPYLPELFNVDFLPPFYFTYWIIAIAVIAIGHEFAHGIFAKINGIRVKSTGFGFLGPFLAAFVEPDEEQMKHIKKTDQLAILGAGSFANLVMTLVFLLILWGFFAAAFSASGFIFSTYAYSVVNISAIDNIGGINTSSMDLSKILDSASLDKMEINGHNFTFAFIDGKKYYLDIDISKSHLEDNYSQTILYDDTPAIRVGLKGVIIEIDGKKVRNQEDLKNILSQKKPGDNVVIVTKIDDEEMNFNVVLAKNPDTGSAYLGIATYTSGTGGLMSKIRRVAIFFKEPNTYYEPRFDGNFAVFIYDLIWWIVLINISVALANMLPLGIFDGGRVFYVTLWGIFKSEKAAKQGYRIATYLFLLIFLLLMIVWGLAMF